MAILFGFVFLFGWAVTGNVRDGLEAGLFYGVVAPIGLYAVLWIIGTIGEAIGAVWRRLREYDREQHALQEGRLLKIEEEYRRRR